MATCHSGSTAVRDSGDSVAVDEIIVLIGSQNDRYRIGTVVTDYGHANPIVEEGTRYLFAFRVLSTALQGECDETRRRRLELPVT